MQILQRQDLYTANQQIRPYCRQYFETPENSWAL